MSLAPGCLDVWVRWVREPGGAYLGSPDTWERGATCKP